jgi:Xaa-Pro aminopeptidase
VVADIFPRSDRTGYWGDMTRTFVKGKASEIVRKAFDAVKQASEESLKMLKAGVPGADVHRTAARTMENLGFRTGRDANGIPCGFIHGLGHGVGLDIHENPRLSPANPNPLAAGSVVSVEPGLYDPSWGGIRLEDLVLVTEDGYENFCTMPKELEIP